MVRRCGPPSQSWKTFLHNHAPDIAAIDLFVVPTIGFKLLYGLVIIHLERRRLIWTNVTTNPTAEWIACQITEAFPRGTGALLPHPRQRRFLWRHSQKQNPGDGRRPRSTNRTLVALAEWACGAADRLDPARMPGPRLKPGRSASAPDR